MHLPTLPTDPTTDQILDFPYEAVVQVHVPGLPLPVPRLAVYAPVSFTESAWCTFDGLVDEATVTAFGALTLDDLTRLDGSPSMSLPRCAATRVAQRRAGLPSEGIALVHRIGVRAPVARVLVLGSVNDRPLGWVGRDGYVRAEDVEVFYPIDPDALNHPAWIGDTITTASVPEVAQA